MKRFLKGVGMGFLILLSGSVIGILLAVFATLIFTAVNYFFTAIGEYIFVGGILLGISMYFGFMYTKENE